MNDFNGNYIDLLILLILIYFAMEAFHHGFWVILADFVSFLGSLLISLSIYKPISEFFKLHFNLGISISNALAFLISAIFLESVLAFIFGNLIYRLPPKLRRHKFDKFLGIIPSLGEGIVLISFILTFVIAFPVKPQIKEDIFNSKIGGFLVQKTVGVEIAINEVFGGVINDSLTYLTINPSEHESIILDVGSYKLETDETGEIELLQFVNKEREKLAMAPLLVSYEATIIARKHAEDMWKRKYFSHYSPEGEDVGDRLLKENIYFQTAGENLALAPTIISAHQGLMNSKGHRENILNPNFRKIGIGVINNGIYGKMFVQIFTD